MDESSSTSTADAPNAILFVDQSSVHGLGVFARQSLAADTCIGAYEGRRYSPEMALLGEWGEGMTYLFALSDGTTIDGRRGGNATRHLNHACAPNCEAREEMGSDNVIVLRLFTLQAVAKDDELFLDYALIIDPSETTADYPCHCGTIKCRGTMAAVAA